MIKNVNDLDWISGDRPVLRILAQERFTMFTKNEFWIASVVSKIILSLDHANVNIHASDILCFARLQ